MTRLEALFSADKVIRDQYVALTKRIGQENAVLKTLEEKLADAQGAADRRKVLQAEREDAYRRVFEAIINEQTALAELYNPLLSRLAASSGTLRKLGFYVRRVVDVSQWGAFAEKNLLDQRKAGPLNGRGSLTAHAEIMLKPAWEKGTAAEIQKAMTDWIHAIDNETPLDLVIANAGIGLGQNDAPTLAEITERTFDINVQGVFNTIHPALDRMIPRRRGQIAIMSSVAGFVGMPGAAPYAASKAAVRSYGEGLRGAYYRHNVEINVICPGFVVSRMTDRNRFRMPFLMDTDKAAQKIVHGLERNKPRIAFPWQMYGSIRLLQMMPVWLADRLLRRSPRK